MLVFTRDVCVGMCVCFGGGDILYVCVLCGGVCVHSMCGLHVVWLGSCWGLFVLSVTVCVCVWGDIGRAVDLPTFV